MATFSILKRIFTVSCLFLLTISLSGQLSEKFRYSLEWKKSEGHQSDLVLHNENFSGQLLSGTGLLYDTRPFINASIRYVILHADKTEVLQLVDSVKTRVTNTEFTVAVSISEVRKNYTLISTVNTLRINADGQTERLINFNIEVFYDEIISSALRNPESTYTSALSTGDIYKISVSKTGIYKLDKSFLESKLGINLSAVNPKKIKIFGNRGGRVPEANNAPRTDDLEELKIFVAGESDGKFDASDFILFYAEGADIWNYNSAGNTFNFDKNIYDDFNYYFLKIDNQDGKRIGKSALVSEIADVETENYDFLQRLEDDKVNLLGAYASTEGTGKDWYGDIYNNNSREKTLTPRFDFTGVNLQFPLEISMIFAARSKTNTSLQLSIGSKAITKNISSVNVLNSESVYAKKLTIREILLVNEINPTVKLTYPLVSADAEGWLDYLQIIASRVIALNNTQLSFRSRITKMAKVAALRLTNYSDQTIWDVTDPFSPTEMNISQSLIKFYPDGKVREFVAHNQLTGAFEPVAVGKIVNQNLHAIEDEKMIIVYHPKFKSEALRLGAYRQKTAGYKVITASTDEVYNEFSSGRVDPAAIRDMARLLLNRNPAFRYLLLFGDGSYDYKGLMKNVPNENFVPVYETDESLDPIDGFPSDDFYGLLGETEGVNLVGGLDIYVGRLPAKNINEAKVLVDKIIHYETSPDVLWDWRLRTGYVADDEDGNTHVRDMDDIAKNDEVRHPLYNQQKMYADAFKQISTPGENRYPDANKAINNSIFKGQLTLTYLGHGGPLGWAQERILTIPEIQSWTNINSLSIMVTATCSFGAYDGPEVVSPAEFAILNPKGGAIALFTTTRAVYTNSNKQLTDGVHELMYKKINGVPPTLGFILAEGKNKYQGDFFRINSRKFTLLGDPSLQVAMPKHNVYSTKINGKDAINVTDTLNALENVTIEGYIGDATGNIISDFNGTIYPTVYDKKSTLQTLANDPGSSKFTYTMYKNIIFKGAATVKDGKWSFTFRVPKNINYSLGKGRISYYATDGISMDAGGLFTNVIIGGSGRSVTIDDKGPEMGIYMNDENFVSGGLTNTNPVLLLNLADDLGINVTGNAIGQDITATLDGDSQNIFVLNDFYEAQKDDYTKGKVKFPLSNLKEGKHYITAKAWDISGNSTQKRIDFYVAENGISALSNVRNYPNPFTSETTFVFEHDLADTEIEISLNIYSITGKLIKNISETKYSSGFRVNDIFWDGREDFESGLNKGMYLYNIKIHSKELNQTRESKFEKLIKL
jgi:hypothetical protein